MGDIRQRGLIAGIELVADKESKKPYGLGRAGRSKSLRRGEKKRASDPTPWGMSLFLFPAPVITRDELVRMVDIVKQSIATVTEGEIMIYETHTCHRSGERYKQAPL